MESFLSLGIVCSLLVLGYVAGRRAERRHYASIRDREARLLKLMAIPLKNPPHMQTGTDSRLVCGSVVISLDYFKRFLAGVRMLFGGRVRVYETLVDRARREAVLRMKEEAEKMGASAIVCVRLETSRLASSRGNGKGIGGVEVLAFGTAILGAHGFRPTA